MAKSRGIVGIKKGGLSRDERLYIEKFFAIKSDEEIGIELKRSPNQVSKYRREIEEKKNNVNNVQEKNKYLGELRGHPHYENLRRQFTKEEFVTFESKYIGMLMQFKEVTFTEQEQIFTYITTSIYVDRLGEEKLQTLKEINRQSVLLEELYDKGADFIRKNTERIMNIEGQLATLRSLSSTKTQEYERLTKRQDDIMKNLKGTREQRVRKAEDSKISFIGLMRFLDDEDNRKQVGVEMALNQAALEHEKQRLGKYHTYANGEIDRPLLTYETVAEKPVVESQQ